MRSALAFCYNNKVELSELSKACLCCPVPKCGEGCPLHNPIKEANSLIKEGKIEEAARLWRENNPFMELTSRLCDTSRQCEGHCVKAKIGAVEIHSIERLLAEHAKRDLTVKPSNGKKIALIGAGPGNLSVAYFLLRGGYAVDIYEKEARIGGAIHTGIPAFRFAKHHLSLIRNDLSAMGACFHMNEEIKDLAPLRESHDRLVLGVGASAMNYAGNPLTSWAIGGLSLLRDLNLDAKAQEYQAKYKKAVVWGGGNVAMDCARSLVRLLPEVHVVYRRSEAQMPADPKEIQAAREEGVQFDFLTNVSSIDLESKTLHLVRMELGEPDESGRASFHEIPDSGFEEKVDLLIYAIGQKVDLSPFGELDPSIYLVGDAHLGPKTVAEAIADGKRVAMEIIKSFQEE